MTNNQKEIKLEEKRSFALWNSFTDKFFSERTKTPRRKLFNTLWAVVFGFILSSIVIGFSNQNPFAVFTSLFYEGTTTYGNKLISIFTAYLIASLAVAICLKAGLFNIGISGQMMAGGFTTLLIFKAFPITNGTNVFLAIAIAILIGSFVAVVAGMLKTYFGINEVVSTIMLNWIIFFVIKFCVQDLQGYISNEDSLSNNLSLGYIMPNFYQPSDLNFSWYSNNWNWIILSIAFVLVIGLWLTISKTSFGYKIRMVGLNKDAADYSGTNKNSLILIVMAISGALSGLAGFIWYTGQGGQIDISEQPLLAGFDAIAISLLVYNNPIGIVFSSFVYGTMKVGSAAIPTEFIGIPKEINEIVVGVMVYSAAIAVAFTKLNVFDWIKNFFILSGREKYRTSRVKYWKANIDYGTSWFKIQKDINSIKIKNRRKWKDINNNYKHEITSLERKLFEKYKDKMNKKFNVEFMLDDDQMFYFNELAKLKKERNLKLAQHSFYEKNNIKARRQEKFKLEKARHQAIKNEVIDVYEKYKKTKNMIKKYKFFKANQLEAEEVILVSWIEINSIDLSKGNISKKKIDNIKTKIKNYAQNMNLLNLVQEGGK